MNVFTVYMAAFPIYSGSRTPDDGIWLQAPLFMILLRSQSFSTQPTSGCCYARSNYHYRAPINF